MNAVSIPVTEATMARQPFYPFKSEKAKAEYEAYCLERFKAWPPGSETRLLDTASGQTCVRACGRATDPPLILLAGARHGSLMWTEMAATLAAHHRIYALDTLGDAGFSVNRGALSKPDDFVTWTDEVLAVLSPERPVSMMGISYGGWIIGQYALRHPERLRSVVLLAPGATVLPISFAFFARVVALCLPLPGMGGARPLRKVLYWLFQDAARTSDASRAFLEQVIADMQKLLPLFALPRPPWPTVIDDATWQDFRVPCLFMVGEHEKIYSAQKAVRRLNRVAPQVKTEIIPGAGHDLMMVQADLVISEALGFFDTPVLAAA